MKTIVKPSPELEEIEENHSRLGRLTITGTLALASLLRPESLRFSLAMFAPSALALDGESAFSLPKRPTFATLGLLTMLFRLEDRVGVL